MTREELVQAIIESGGPWSCPGWEKCENVPDCEECSEKQLIEYENQIRDQALDDLVKMVHNYYTRREKAGYFMDNSTMINYIVADFAEQLKAIYK